jgi:hypothetical protein
MSQLLASTVDATVGVGCYGLEQGLLQVRLAKALRALQGSARLRKLRKALQGSCEAVFKEIVKAHNGDIRLLELPI